MKSLCFPTAPSSANIWEAAVSILDSWVLAKEENPQCPPRAWWDLGLGGIR